MSVIINDTESRKFTCGEGNCVECPLVQSFYKVKYTAIRKRVFGGEYYYWCPFKPEEVWRGMYEIPEKNPLCPCKNKERNCLNKENFIQYVKDEFGVDISCVKSDNPDTFDKLFG